MSEPDDALMAVITTHDLEWDPPHSLSGAARWTCRRCERAVLKVHGNVYGSATEVACPETQP